MPYVMYMALMGLVSPISAVPRVGLTISHGLRPVEIRIWPALIIHGSGFEPVPGEANDPMKRGPTTGSHGGKMRRRAEHGAARRGTHHPQLRATRRMEPHSHAE